MSKFDRFTTEELLIIKWALYIVIVNNEDRTLCNESEYEIVKSLYKRINEYQKERNND